MQLRETYVLPRASRYSTPANGSDILPIPWGDWTGPVSGYGTLPCVEINTDDDVWALAGCAITTNNDITLYDDDGEISSSEYAITYGDDYESTGLDIAYATFSTPPTGQVSSRLKGRAPEGTLLENPIDQLEDMLDLMDVDLDRNATAFARTWQLAEDQSYTAAGAFLQDQEVAFWISQLMASFLGDWWLNHDGELMVSLDMATDATYNIMAFLGEVTLDGSPSRALENCCNQPAVYYAPNYSNTDRRSTSGASKGNFDGFDDGSSVADGASQTKFSIRTKPFTWYWVRSATVAATLQGFLVAHFGTAPWLVPGSLQGFQHVHLERGDYVVASCRVLRDENRNALKNQIWRVLELTKDPNTFNIAIRLQDTGKYFALPPITYNGDYQIGSYNGRPRDERTIL